jgi:eukaryotic-like serine/threonine-protein kinase
MAAETANRQIGNYELLSKIAEGGMGAVYKARSIINSEIVAIKIVPAETAKNPVLMKRFEQEFRAASLFDHPNIVRAIEYCGTVATPFLVMEFVDGESLGQRVERAGPMDEAEAIRAIAQVCDGLHRAHKQGLIHRDVKPDNILLRSDGVAKLTDMGLVKDVEGELNLTKTGRGLGTPHFMAPEQFRNAKNADVRCDIYSLGATLYMLVTGVVPFARTSPLDCWLKKKKNDFDPPKKLNAQLSDRVNRAILRAMSADPARRPTSCREFLEDLTGQPWTNRAEVTDTPLSIAISPELPENDLWYLVYKDTTGQQKTVKGSTARIWDNLKAGMLGDLKAVLLCRTKTGPFMPVASVPEFRVLAVPPATLAPEAVNTGRGTPAKASPIANRPAIDPMIPQPPLPPKPPEPIFASDLEELPSPKPVPTGPQTRSQSVIRRTTAPAKRKDSSATWLPWVFIGVTILVAAIGAAVLSR